MPTRLLIGLAEAGAVDDSRRYLLELLEKLAGHDVAVQVALFDEGPVRRELEALADVRLFKALPPRSPSGLVQSAARRVSLDLADRVHDVRARDDLRWIEDPDGVLLHGPRAATLLRYLRDPSVPVTTYSHHLDFSIAGLSRLDLDRLLAMSDRYLVDSDAVAADLVAAGVDRRRIDRAPQDVEVPLPVVDPFVGSELRARHGFSRGGIVVGVPPVSDWVDCPDLTLGVAWALERIDGPAAPDLAWVGMPGSGPGRWPVDYDVDRMGLRSVRLISEPFTWEGLVALADVVVLPLRTEMELPAEFARHASRRATPVICWDGHDRAADVVRWDGTVVNRGDVEGMARRIWQVTADQGALRRARRALWKRYVADVERVLPVEVPLP